MNTFRTLWHAIENLASSLNGLAATVNAFCNEVQERSGVSVDTGPRLLTDGNGAEPALPSPRKRR
jgi:hypothetical protein